ncbi:hypothetical protein LTR56_016220 [Elasticomyces elasticus]|nr:hypothetical protein LTR56_016220 [Elasticomyces elasticus]KAK3636061.1 hypothetical protein LTR22_018908 [Elasticomyces elasticus]KAK4912325.1 hypothetical protein LTR49_019233 [Elasticomyces elasticus]KAK5751398.1 hypothetical protein LTS12_018556 [Elasticomyces elasticus]
MADDERPAKRARYDFDFADHIHVLVGPSKRDFVVHVGVLTKRSAFFKAAVSKRWKTSGDGTKAIVLPDDDASVFHDYLQCMYTGTVRTGYLRRVIDIYILADKLQDPASMNITINAIIRSSDEKNFIPGRVNISHAWKRTAPGSKLRKLLVDYYVHEVTEKVMSKENEEGLDFEDFYYEVITGLVKVKAEVRAAEDSGTSDGLEEVISERPRCYYHQHDDWCPPCASDGSGSDSGGSESE